MSNTYLNAAHGAALGAILGCLAGSFLSTLVLRWPAGRSIVVGRSACDGCGRQLSAVELIPLVSFLIRRGRCRTCRSTIDWRHPALEAAATIVGALSLAVDPGWGGFAGAVFGWWLVTLAALDVGHLWLPDRLTLPLLAIGLATGAAGLPPSLANRVIAAIAAYLALAALAAGYRHIRGRIGMGGGDPKLFAAIGAWIGWQALPWTLLLASVSGLSVAGALYLAGRPIDSRSALPFGAFLAFAGWLVWLAGAALR